MTLLFCDGFESGTGNWQVTSPMALGTGRFGNGMVVTGNTGCADAGFVATAGPIIAGLAYRPSGASPSGGTFSAYTSTANVQIGMIRNPGGGIDVFRTTQSQIIGSTANNVLPLNAWSYIEWKAVFHASTGSVVVRVNGVQVLNLTNVNTAGPTANALRIGGSGTGSISGAWDDVYICDTTGTVNNDFIGEIMVEHLYPASDDTAQWLGSDSDSVNNWDLVNESGVPVTTDYVASSTPGQRDLYTVNASARPTTSPVKGILVSAFAQKTDVGLRTAKITIKEGAGGTVRQSVELGLPTTFGELVAPFDRKADGSAWTISDINALRIGYEVIA